MNTFGLYISVPITCFRVPYAREYLETFSFPPPSTVYGLLLSMVGEVNRRTYEGAEIAVAMLSNPACSILLRTVWRVKNSKEGLGLKNNRRPDYQELLTDVRLAIWVRKGKNEKNPIPFVERIQTSLMQPELVSRFGGLSLGESTHLVDEISILKNQNDQCQLLVAKTDGNISLPIWPDHVGSSTLWGQYDLDDFNLGAKLPEVAWTAIQRPN